MHADTLRVLRLTDSAAFRKVIDKTKYDFLETARVRVFSSIECLEAPLYFVWARRETNKLKAGDV